MEIFKCSIKINIVFNILGVKAPYIFLHLLNKDWFEFLTEHI